ncbi:hypothetical protein GCK72_021138 [Caenorhabditis remanei]|uniref:F-box domain-containing protein n=1 Tax=Caenorhabditis remanei TaxID=31234 RepID=A0A6A5GIX9_CAERE|nr:hypothetical protein GCK72_021131 [Caenorhabditis remanei]XP_053582956.1 hypothetical protein GCK72_021134 [Caenorhabditis remanei]XP_053582960.1 hypothetical protein GCK72_021138 [Caenorhabditis remanei]KAF1754568.1 hypothetical protein GCK72_021131 [Caenorhabditis remanei]KAF1754571.1 hypothetical protein GCK72_021134 [Caenorhabditis remanei]KAF1754575.1 hypothetical protein GCK72_021138 [Caenorhabditis remanei]
MTTPFFLLRLPRLALIPVLQQMEPIDLIAFSLLSNKAKNLVKMLCKITAGSINVVFKSHYPRITVVLRDDTSVGLSLYTERVPDVANMMLQHKTISCEKKSITVAKLVERIVDVTSCQSLELVVLRGPLQLEVCDTLALLTKLSKLTIMRDCSNCFARKALEIVSTVTTQISLCRIPFETGYDFQTFLKSNLNSLYIYSCFSRFTLEDLLVTNALKVVLRQVKLSARDITQFITNWFHSKNNSRLEHLSLLVDEVVNEMCLPEVLEAVPFPRDQERTFFYSKHLDYSSESFRGGYDIKRTNGKKATIVFVPGHGVTFIDFYVWP